MKITSRIALRSGELDVELAPALGGSVARMSHAGREVLRPLSAESEGKHDVLGVACFPMVPYANRIDRNGFVFDGLEHRFEPNLPPYPFNEHGSGWTSAWAVAETEPSRALLRLDRCAPDEPYSFRAAQEFVLSPDTLTIRMEVENTGSKRMPFGFGQHPWFPRDADVSLCFEATHFWLEGPGGSATDRITLPPELSFAHMRPLPASWRNNCYSGWRGVADIHYPRRGLTVTLEADPVFGHLMLYADPELDVFCLEPQTHASCAFNKRDGYADTELGVLILEPRQRATGAIRLRLKWAP